MDFLDKLNPQQKSAVTAGNGPVLVVAGPGSGKTRVLTQRIAYLIAVEGVRPWQILAVTFTNKAAREMSERVSRLLPDQAIEGMMLGTFHSICARILRREADNLPIQSNFVILDSDDQERLVKTIVKDFGLVKKDKNNKSEELDEYRASKVLATISRAKNELIAPSEYLDKINTFKKKRDQEIQRIYEEYQKRLTSNNAVDFDDILVYTAKLLRDFPSIREKYSQKYRHVLVDEFQDTNIAQYTIVQYLASGHRNIFCVGDPDQSIYKFRGADWRNIQRFEEDFPDAMIILLEQNYRSYQNILDAAMSIIDKAQNRRKKYLFTNRGTGEKIFFYEAWDDRSEATFVVDTITQLVISGKYKYNDCAVMYRTNAQSRLVEEAFMRERLPHQLIGAQRFYKRREVKDIVAYLSLIHNLANEASLSRIINTPKRGIGDTTFSKLRAIAQENDTTTGAVLLDLAQGPASKYYKSFSSRAALSLVGFAAMLARWRIFALSYTIPELFDKVVEDIGYQEYITSEKDDLRTSNDPWENVQELRRLAEEYTTRTMDDFLENIALVSDQDTIEEGNVATLLTLHAAKGLEFNVVFIIGLDKGILPHDRSLNNPDEMDEERRLFYVGITRAKDLLYLTRAIQRIGFSQRDRDNYDNQSGGIEPSPFLDDIPIQLLAGKTRTGRSISTHTNTNWSFRAASQSIPIIEISFPPGTRVRHSIFGEGTVIENKNEILEIEFSPSVGRKRIIASTTNITAIE